MTGSSARQAAGLAVLMVYSGLACSDPTDVDPCSGTVDLTVIEGTTPEFRWGPCAVNSLVVFDAAAQPIWNVHAPNTANTMAPPFTTLRFRRTRWRTIRPNRCFPATAMLSAYSGPSATGNASSSWNRAGQTSAGDDQGQSPALASRGETRGLAWA